MSRLPLASPAVEECPVHVNNPYTTRWARCYDRLFCIPPFTQIRRSEERTLDQMMASTFRPGDDVLEVGPGTGRYTVEFARRIARLTAVEHSLEMITQLHRTLEREAVDNCTIIHSDFMQAPLAQQYDVVAIIGVLDYVEDPATFLGKAASLARRELLFTTPYCGLLAHLHRIGNNLRGIAVTTYNEAQIRSYLPDFDVEIAPSGLHTSLWRGLTLVCRATRP
ncbi:MAG: class I SAM-dependent methyltransferase [Armatimonadia bacterium]